MSTIEQNSFGYAEREQDKNWAAAYAEHLCESLRREHSAALAQHKTNTPLDHDDRSVTGEKLADGAVSKRTLATDVEQMVDGKADKTATDLALAAKADKISGGGGFVGGQNAQLRTEQSVGGAIGKNAAAGDGFAGGRSAKVWSGSAAGYLANAANGGASGQEAETGDGFAGGYRAKCVNGGSAIDAIQLGTGTNTEAKSLQVYDKKLMGADGKIPIDRIPDSVGKTTEPGGFAGGQNSSAGSGKAAGGAIGKNTYSYRGFAGGEEAKCGYGAALGYSAKCMAADASKMIDAIQLGTGTTTEEKSLQVYDKKLMKADGTIPTERLGKSTVKSAHIGIHEVKTANLDTKAVTENNLADKAVTTRCIGTKAITNMHINDQAIQTYAIADGAVTLSKLADGVAEKLTEAAVPQVYLNFGKNMNNFIPGELSQGEVSSWQEITMDACSICVNGRLFSVGQQSFEVSADMNALTNGWKILYLRFGYDGNTCSGFDYAIHDDRYSGGISADRNEIEIPIGRICTEKDIQPNQVLVAIRLELDQKAIYSLPVQNAAVGGILQTAEKNSLVEAINELHMRLAALEEG